MIKSWFKDITGKTALEEKLRLEEEARKRAEQIAEQQKKDAAIAEARLLEERKLREEAEEVERIATMTPKEKATARGEPWVAVLDTHVQKDNIRNGFFELDWNDHFVLELKRAGYGFDGDPEEEIVDRWFRDLARNMLNEEGMDPTRGAGYINVIPIDKGRSEIS